MNPTTTTLLEIRMLVAVANRATGRLVGDRGEGVISTAIAVLTTAFIGAAMWLAFTAVWGNAEADITNQIDSIGS